MIFAEQVFKDYMKNAGYIISHCFTLLLSKENSGNFTKFVQAGMEYLGPVDLTQYFIKSYNITDSDGIVMASTFGNKGVKVEFTLGRKRLNQVITGFLPLILLTIVTFSSALYQVRYSSRISTLVTIILHHFQREEFEAVVTVNVTIFLVMTTLFIGVSNSLPRTAYVKMIEIYLLFSMSMPFSEVLLITAIDVMR